MHDDDNLAQQKEVRDAPPPFDRSALTCGADIILRSSDMVDFYTVKGLLTITSPNSLFAGFLASHSFPDVTKDDLPVIILQEEQSNTVELILRIATPGPDPDIPSPEDLLAMAHMADKYVLEGILGRLEQIILGSRFLREKPLICYAIGARFDWKRVCEEAVPYSLALTWEELLQPDKAMDLLHPTHLQALWRHRMICTKRNQEIAGFDTKALIHREGLALPDFLPAWFTTNDDCVRESARYQGGTRSVHTWVRVFLSHLVLHVVDGTILTPELKPRVATALEACRSKNLFKCRHSLPSSLELDDFVQKLENQLRDVPKFEFEF